MKKRAIYNWLISVAFLLMMASCSNFLEPKSQSEYVPKLIKSLDELLLGEVYMGPDVMEGQFYGVLGLFDDDVAIRAEWNANPNEENKINKIKLAYTWSKEMKDHFPGYNTYGDVYKKILGCNAVMDYIDDVQGSVEEVSYVKAQALALRSYFYFHLVNLYGKPYYADKNALGVPLKLDSKMGTSGMARHTVDQVYQQILQDLQEAERLFETIKGESIYNKSPNRINLPCTQLILSRVYLYMEEWEQALQYAEKVISNYTFEVMDLNILPEPHPSSSQPYINYYTWENPEMIFLFGNQGDNLSLPMTRVSYANKTGSGSPSYESFYLAVASEDLIFSFDVADLRKTHYLIWEVIKNRETPPVYKQPTSKFPAIRDYHIEAGPSNGIWGTAFKVTEAYLNAAEASAMLYKNTGNTEYMSKSHRYVDEIRINRFHPSSFTNTTIDDSESLVNFVRDERRRELCFENHRWFDLRRYGMNKLTHIWYDQTGNATEYTLDKNASEFVLQIPNEAFDYNPDMVQN